MSYTVVLLDTILLSYTVVPLDMSYTVVLLDTILLSYTVVLLYTILLS